MCHHGHVQDASQGLPGLFFFNWVDQWMMTRLNGFNLGGSSQSVTGDGRREIFRQAAYVSGADLSIKFTSAPKILTEACPFTSGHTDRS